VRKNIWLISVMKLDSLGYILYFSEKLNFSVKESTTYHFERIFHNTSGFNPEIEVRSFTSNAV